MDRAVIPAAPARSGPARGPRRVALGLAALALLLGVAGAISFRRFVTRAESDPGVIYRDPATLAKLLKQAHAAEERGDRASAIVAYRFVVAVGAGGDSVVARYVAAARVGLERLTPAAPGTPPHRPR